MGVCVDTHSVHFDLWLSVRLLTLITTPQQQTGASLTILYSSRYLCLHSLSFTQIQTLLLWAEGSRDDFVRCVPLKNIKTESFPPPPAGFTLQVATYF